MKSTKNINVLLALSAFLVLTCPRMDFAATAVDATIVAGSSNDYVYVYNEAGNLLWNYDTGAEVVSVATSSDGSYIAVGSLNNKLYLFERDGDLVSPSWPQPVPVSSGNGGWMGRESKSVAISADGAYVVAGCTDNLYIFNNNGILHRTHLGNETCVDISPDGNYVAACAEGGDVHLYSIDSVSNIPLWTKSINAFWVATSNPGYVAVSNADTLFLYADDGILIWSYSHAKWDSDYIRLHMPDDGSGIVVVNDDPGDSQGSVLCFFDDEKDGTPGWSSSDGTPVWEFVPNPDVGTNDFYSVAVSANGNIIATGPAQGSYILSRDSDEPVQTYDMGSIQSFGLSADGQFGAVGDRQSRVWFFNKDSATPSWHRNIGEYVQAVAVATSLTTSDDWPMFHHDFRHTGYSSSWGPSTDNVLWTFQTGYLVRSSPAVVDGRVFIGSHDNRIYCLDALGNMFGTTNLVWSYTASHDVESSPTVVNNKLYIGSDDGNIYCLDAQGNPDTTTDLIWSYTTGQAVKSSPVVVDAKVYVGSHNGNVYCLDAQGNGDGTTNLIWSHSTSGGVFSSPAVVDGKVYVGSWDNNVYCLDAQGNSDGTTNLIWTYTTGGDVSSSPAVANGKVYIGSDDYNVYCLDAGGNGDGTTNLIWSYPTGDWVISSPAVAGGKIYVGSSDRNLYCLDAQGNGDGTTNMIWRFVAPGTYAWVDSSPAVENDKVYVQTYKGFYCLDAQGNGDGTTNIIWDHSARGYSSPAIVDGKVYVGSENSRVYAFGPSGDYDGDGFSDNVDVCPDVYDPGQNDADGDGIGDMCECLRANIDGTDPIDFRDLALLTADWLMTGFSIDNPNTDINRDGLVNNWDYAHFSGYWRQYCYPYPSCWNWPTQCHGDADGDSDVDSDDQTILNNSMWSFYHDCLYSPCADFNRNGKVDSADQTILDAGLGLPPDPDCPLDSTWPPMTQND